MNDQADGVGISLEFNGRGFLWQNGAMTDLNSLISKNPPCT
jgi:probable HAF family extracellular repeat protein